MKDYRIEAVNFVMRTEIMMGEGILKDITNHLKANRFENIGLVIDKELYASNPYCREIYRLLSDNLRQVVLVLNEMPEPTYDYLDEIKVNLQPYKIDCCVGVGGGSTIDLAKGLAVMQTNDGRAIQYRGFDQLQVPPIPTVAVPSTAGSGSEVTPYAVFIDTGEKWKFGINSTHNYPRFAVLDPKILESCPLQVFASSGMDAMTHALESFAANNASALSRMYSVRAFELLFKNLNRIAQGDKTVATIIDLQLGAALAGIALMNSGAGPAGALSYPLGVFFNVPHGLAGSVFLTGVIQYNVACGYTEYSTLYDRIHGPEHLTARQKSEAFVDDIQHLSRNLGIPVTLEGFGVHSKKDAQLICNNAMQLKAAFDQNPVEFGPQQIEQLIYSLC